MLAIAAVLLLFHSILPHLTIHCFISFHPLIFYVKSIYNFLYWYPLSSIILNDFNPHLKLNSTETCPSNRNIGKVIFRSKGKEL